MSNINERQCSIKTNIGGQIEKNGLICVDLFWFCPFGRMCRESPQDRPAPVEEGGEVCQAGPELRLDIGALEMDGRPLCLGRRALDKSEAGQSLGQRTLEKKRPPLCLGAGALEVKGISSLIFFVFF